MEQYAFEGNLLLLAPSVEAIRKVIEVHARKKFRADRDFPKTIKINNNEGVVRREREEGGGNTNLLNLATINQN